MEYLRTWSRSIIANKPHKQYHIAYSLREKKKRQGNVCKGDMEKLKRSHDLGFSSTPIRNSKNKPPSFRQFSDLSLGLLIIMFCPYHCHNYKGRDYLQDFSVMLTISSWFSNAFYIPSYILIFGLVTYWCIKNYCKT